MRLFTLDQSNYIYLVHILRSNRICNETLSANSKNIYKVQFYLIGKLIIAYHYQSFNFFFNVLMVLKLNISSIKFTTKHILTLPVCIVSNKIGMLIYRAEIHAEENKFLNTPRAKSVHPKVAKAFSALCRRSLRWHFSSSISTRRTGKLLSKDKLGLIF